MLSVPHDSSIELSLLKSSPSWTALASSRSIGMSTLLSILDHEEDDGLHTSPSWSSLGMMLIPADSMDSMAQLLSFRGGDNDSEAEAGTDFSFLTQSTSLKDDLRTIFIPTPTLASSSARRPVSILAEMGLFVSANDGDAEKSRQIEVTALPPCLVPGRAARNVAYTVDDLPSFDSLQVLSHLKPTQDHPLIETFVAQKIACPVPVHASEPSSGLQALLKALNDDHSNLKVDANTERRASNYETVSGIYASYL